MQGKTIASIYFGGGTPTLFAPDGIASILEMVRASNLPLTPSCEITIEANPEEGSKEFFEKLRSLGINRLSLGVQSFDDRSLQTLERTHSAKKAKETLFAAHAGGFHNISIDLMYDLPDQTHASWVYTLSQLRDLPIEHVSLYNLTIEPHTAFYQKRNKLVMPQPKISLRMLQTAIDTLEELHFTRYEISAFARNGHTSTHNLGYWTYRPFLGFGPSAYSFYGDERFRNTAHLQKYTDLLKQNTSPIDFREKLPYPQNIKEKFLVQLRLLEGTDFDPQFPPEMQQQIENFIQQGLLRRVGSKIQLTDKGLLFHDTIATEII
jgi:oxygen-independent coproporphyrinogen-3 oxidase